MTRPCPTSRARPHGCGSRSPTPRPTPAPSWARPSYMAPEVAAGLNEEVDERSDIYLLGATLYQILSGRQPRSAKTLARDHQEGHAGAARVPSARSTRWYPRPSTPSASRRWPTRRRTATRPRPSWPRTSSGSSPASPSRPTAKASPPAPGAGPSGTAGPWASRRRPS